MFIHTYIHTYGVYIYIYADQNVYYLKRPITSKGRYCSNSAVKLRHELVDLRFTPETYRRYEWHENPRNPSLVYHEIMKDS